MNFPEERSKKTQEIEQILGTYLPKEEGRQKTLYQAMNYSVLAGGKRLRPMLMQETFRLFGGEGQLVHPFMAAIEMIHTYSLVHDDLPAMDNDEYRRGRKTTHAVYGEAIAILAGDGLLTDAFKIAGKAAEKAKNPHDYVRIIRAVSVLAEKAGSAGMVGGQTADIEAVGQETIAEDQLSFIFETKTAALIEAAMMIGAILAGTSEENIGKVEQIASKVGHAFQIQDDILDVTGSMEELGKPIHSDEKNEKPTYVKVHGLAQATEDVRRLSEEAIDMLEALPCKNPFLNELLKSLIFRKK